MLVYLDFIVTLCVWGGVCRCQEVYPGVLKWVYHGFMGV